MSRWLMLTSLTFLMTLIPLSIRAQTHHDDWEGIRLNNGRQVMALPADSLEIFDFLALILEPHARILSPKALENLMSEPLSLERGSIPLSSRCQVMMSEADEFGNFSLFLNVRESKGLLTQLGNKLAGQPNQSFLEIPISAEAIHEKTFFLDYSQRTQFNSEAQFLEDQVPNEYKIYSQTSSEIVVNFHTGLPSLNIFPSQLEVTQVGQGGTRRFICHLPSSAN